MLRDQEKRRLYDHVRRCRRRRCRLPRAVTPPPDRPVWGRRPGGRRRRRRGHERHLCRVFRCVRAWRNEVPVPWPPPASRAPCPRRLPADRRIAQYGPAIAARQDRRHCAGPAGAASPLRIPGRTGRPPRWPVPPPRAQVSLEELFAGVTKEFDLRKDVVCGTCDGWVAAAFRLPACRRMLTLRRVRRRPALAQCPPRTSRRATSAVAPVFAL